MSQTNQFNETRHSISSNFREPHVANLEASMFTDKTKFSRRNAAEMHISNAELKEFGSNKRAKTCNNSQAGQTRHQYYNYEHEQLLPGDVETLLNTQARNDVFKINMPHS